MYSMCINTINFCLILLFCVSPLQNSLKYCTNTWMEMTVIDMLLIIISLLLINQAQKTNKRVTACSYTVHVSASHAVLYK